MDADDILARQVEQLDKEKRELQIRLKTQEKKVTYACNCHTTKASNYFKLPVKLPVVFSLSAWL